MDAASVPALRLPSVRLGWRLTPLRLALGLTMFALAVRVVGIGMRPLWLDEAFSAWFSAQSWDYLWHVVPTYEAHPPFYYSVLKLWRSLFGGDAVALRSLSVLLSAAAVPVVMLAAFEQERQRPTGHGLLHAGLAGFLAAASPMLVILGQEPRPYPLLTLGYAVATLALLRLMGQFRDGEAGSWPNWLTLAGATELVLWSHGLGVLYGISLALAVAPAWLASPKARAKIVRGVIAASHGRAALRSMLGDDRQPRRRLGHQLARLGTEHAAPTAGALFRPDRGADRRLGGGGARHDPADEAGDRRGPFDSGWTADRALLLLWLGPPLLAALVSAAFVPVFLARTLSGTLVPAYLLIGAAVARSQSPRERRLLTAAICITLTPAAVAMSVRQPQERWDLAAAYLARNVQPGDEVWLYPADSALPLSATGRFIPGKIRAIPQPFPTLTFNGPIRAGWPAVKSVTPHQAAAFAADPALRRVPRVWLVTRQSGIFDPGDDVPRALARVRHRGEAQEWGYIAVRPYDAPAE